MNVLQGNRASSSGACGEPRVDVEGKESLQGEKEGEGGRVSQQRLRGEIREGPVKQECSREILSAEERSPSSGLSQTLSKASNRLTDPNLHLVCCFLVEIKGELKA